MDIYNTDIYIYIFAISTGKHLCWGLFLLKLQALRTTTEFKRDTDTSVFQSILQNV